MPYARISLLRGHPPAYLRALSASLYQAMHEAFEVPAGDCFQVIHQHDPDELVFDRHYLGGPRSDRFVLIAITAGRDRSAACKQAFYRRLVELLAIAPGISTEDVMVTIVTTAAQDWSFGGGRAGIVAGMIAMQYSIALPADYDMAIVRRRIAAKGPLLDTLPGLQFKAYLVADRADPVLPGEQNLYAPFYLWRDAAAMHAFLAGPAFAALCDAFGRPAVQAWMVDTAWTSAALRTARYATRALPAPSPACGNDTDEMHAPDQRVLATVHGYEPQGWTRLRFRLWRDLPPADDDAQRYAVHHLSAPGVVDAAG